MTDIYPFRLPLASLSLALALVSSFPTWAQEANILGLPAVPQPKPGSPAAAAAANKPATSAPLAPAVDRTAISGELGIQHGIQNGIGSVQFTTKATFITPDQRTTAVNTAKAVQQELSKACGTQCKPQKMPTPIILPTGQLQFTLSIKPLYQHLNQTQFVAALQGVPLNLSKEQMAPPIASSTAAASATQVDPQDAAKPSAKSNSPATSKTQSE
jgi:hypothetical protein